MGKLATKHSTHEVVTFSDFTGGLNLALPSEIIADNELQEAVNFEFASDTGVLRVRSGLIPVYDFPWPVSDIIPTPESGVILVRAGDMIHKIDGDEVTHIGNVSGDKPASYEQWGDGEARNSLLMAFGAHLYLYDGTGVDIIDTENAPTAVEVVFVQTGRVIVAQSNSDTIRYSGVGDPTNWIEDTDGDSISVDVGYKDGCSMRAIAAIAGEIIVFKAPEGQPEHGRIYRLQGDYPDWSIIPYSRGSSAWNQMSVLNIGGDVFFLTREGLANLATATEYGDFKLGWVGSKVNTALSPTLSDSCRLWHMPIRSQAWISDGVSGDIWCYHYSIGDNGAWTLMRFQQPVAAAAPAHGHVYVAMGGGVYKMTDDAADDAGTPIEATLKTKTIIRHNQIFLKGITVHYQSAAPTDAVARVGRFEMPLPTGGRIGGVDIARTDYDIARDDDDPLVPSLTRMVTGMARRRCAIRGWGAAPQIEARNGKFSLSMIGLDIAEV